MPRREKRVSVPVCRVWVGIAVALVWGFSSAHSIASQEPRQSVWDGAYGQAQAARGRDLYLQECASCHGRSLTGGETGPSLSGSMFLETWAGMSVADLFDRISVSMPQETPGSLTAQQYADIVARILEVNNFPAGANELSKDASALKAIMIEAKPGGK